MGALPIIAGALRSSLGSRPGAVSQALLGPCHSPASLTLDDFPDHPFLYFPFAGSSPDKVQAEEHLLQLLKACATEALDVASLSSTQRQNTGLFLGSSSFAIGAAEQQYRDALTDDESAIALPYQRYGDLAKQLRNQLGLAAVDYTFSTACTSSANALLYAAQAIELGQLDAALVIGVEGFNRTTLLGFDSLQLLSRSGYRPFDAERDGMVLGEGIAAVVLSRDGLVPPASGWQGVRLLGGANGCDPAGLTGSSAESMARVMEQALQNTATTPSEITLIKAHATGSPGSDAAEAGAMEQLFAQRVLPPITTLKGMLGHTLGACGILEIVALSLSLQNGKIPPACGFSRADDEFNCQPISEPLSFSGGRIMCNYFGFGGNNTSLILEYAQ